MYRFLMVNESLVVTMVAEGSGPEAASTIRDGANGYESRFRRILDHRSKVLGDIQRKCPLGGMTFFDRQREGLVSCR